MPAQFAATIQALKKGTANRPIKAAIKKIGNWEEPLQEIQVPSARAILRDLGALKRQLEHDKPGIERVHTTVSRLAEAAEKLAAKLHGREAEKARDLAGNMREATESGDTKREQHLSQRPASGQAKRRSLREEHEHRLPESTGGSRKMASCYERSSRYGEDEYEPRGPSGRVRDPEHDHRLRGHESERLYESRRRGDDGRGRVIDPERDHRLRGDYAALSAALATPAAYVAFVSSPAKAQAMRGRLTAEGFDEASRARLHAPAGLDIGSETPAEIALAILAEITSFRHAKLDRSAL